MLLRHNVLPRRFPALVRGARSRPQLPASAAALLGFSRAPALAPRSPSSRLSTVPHNSSPVPPAASPLRAHHTSWRTRPRAPPLRPARLALPRQADAASLEHWAAAAQTLGGDKPRPGGAYRIALLIDAENISYKHVPGIVHEVSKLGVATVRRIYADWTNETMRGWRPVVLANALTPVHMFNNTVGKGSTDSALIIDAMDMLYTKDLDSFCIVSSDADFTRLCTKLREEGKLVLGIGASTTPAPFIVACNRFVYLNNLVNPSSLPGLATQSPFAQPPFAQPPVAQPPVAQPPAALATPLATAAPLLPPVASMPPSKSTEDKPAASPSAGAADRPSSALGAHEQDDKRRLAVFALTRAWVAYRSDSGWAPLAAMERELHHSEPWLEPQDFGFGSVEALVKGLSGPGQVFEVRPAAATAAAGFQPPGPMVRRVVRAIP
jgi:uncharacterized protein (TIGR00288 family)